MYTPSNALSIVPVFSPILNAHVTGVSKGAMFFAVEQFLAGRQVMNIGRCGFQTVDQSQRIIHADVHSHPEVPLIALKTYEMMASGIIAYLEELFRGALVKNP